MSDLDWLDYMDELNDNNPFTPDELPRQWREAYDAQHRDWQEAA